MNTPDDLTPSERIQAILTQAVAGLDPIDREERIAWCQANDEHGVRMQLDGDLRIFNWGGRVLAMVHQDVLLGTGPIEASFVPAVPDDPRELM
ncbi:hypothetical protein [Mycobacterium asiaticum]|uniref:Uncharacterized protein n=1 Tax=Mycobacterium asiaticum TaxID=1790 RepID=A0A1A3L2S1_MYCAS|nr:hypothetical protein [Mycobacterium asiaticum]OBJ90903.1 hypothetical protein A5640_02080 [Mycobacterium asiaticum]